MCILITRIHRALSPSPSTTRFQRFPFSVVSVIANRANKIFFKEKRVITKIFLKSIFAAMISKHPVSTFEMALSCFYYNARA